MGESPTHVKPKARRLRCLVEDCRRDFGSVEDPRVRRADVHRTPLLPNQEQCRCRALLIVDMAAHLPRRRLGGAMDVPGPAAGHSPLRLS